VKLMDYYVSKVDWFEVGYHGSSLECLYEDAVLVKVTYCPVYARDGERGVM
jgi:hypothetical protein